MSEKPRPSLSDRVAKAAEAALADHRYVSAIDVFLRMGFLASSHVSEWRTGRAFCLEEVIQGSPAKIAEVMETLAHWARIRGLQPVEIASRIRTRASERELRFSRSGEPDVERTFRMHFLSPALSEKQKQTLLQKLSSPPELIVFWTRRDAQCAGCKAELPHGSFLLLEEGQPLCMTCAGLDHLVYVPSGDPALTRRARKHSGLSAVVVRFSRTRKRYERQGILVEEAALRRAQAEQSHHR